MQYITVLLRVDEEFALSLRYYPGAMTPSVELSQRASPGFQSISFYRNFFFFDFLRGRFECAVYTHLASGNGMG